MKELFVIIFRFFDKRKPVLFGLFIGLSILFTYLALQLSIENDLNAMMPKDAHQKDKSSILTKSKQLDKIIVSVALKDSKASDPDLLTTAAEEYSNLLLKNDANHLIEHIETKQNEERFLTILSSVQNNFPFLLNQKDYQKIDSLLNEHSIQSILEKNYRTLASPGGIALKQLIAKDPLGLSFIAFNKLKDFQQDESIELYDGYLMSKDLKNLTFFIYPTFPASNTKQNSKLEPLLKSCRDSLLNNSDFKTSTITYFGGQLVAAGNAKQMQADTNLTLCISIALLLILFIVFFRSFFAPLQIMLPVVFGGVFGMAMLYLIRGHVSIIALGASSIILGIAVNYSLHFLAHFRHSQNKEETIKELASPMTIGSFTTIFAFFSLVLVHTPVLQELGLFTGFNLIGSSLCTLIFMPHFLKQETVHTEVRETWLDKLSLYNPNKNKWIVIGICLMTMGLSFFSNKVRFNEDMMKMNFMSPELKHSQDIINLHNAESLNSVFCVSEGKTLDEALRINEISVSNLDELKQKGIIRKYSSVSNFIQSDSLESDKISAWNSFWTTEKKVTLLSNVRKIGGKLGFQQNAFEGIETILNTNYTKTDSTYTSTFNSLFKDLIVHENTGYKLITLIKVKQENRKQLFDSFHSTNQNYLTDRQFITSQFVSFIKDDFYKILFLTSFIVFLTILISYGRIEIALISFIPMVVTWICILGLMGLFNIEFNIINIIISTLIFGLGDDYSIFISDGLLDKYKYGKTKINSIKASIYLSAITTIIGLGVLIFAKHPALRSIALVSVIGIFSILLVSQTIQPLLFNFLIQNRTDKKQHPFTLWSLAKTVFAFLYYVTGCTLATLLGFIFTKCIPLAKDKLKYAYHVVLCKTMWSLLYIMANAKKHFFGKEHIHFEEPSVVIANHSSFLDLLRIISLYPKILLLTNKWVWRSPVFGALVRMADYYPVEEGADYSVGKMKYWVERGYSIAVFPEGTRSYTDEINRFHKGAFFLAEKLNLDIQPIIFHGIGYTMSKGDFLLKDGEINCKFLPRIDKHDTSFGTTYTERTKLISRYFKKEYDLLRKERQTVHYYREQLIKNYIYKGPVLEWYCRIKTKLEKNYEPIEKLVPKTGNILDIGCGYGFLAYILAWTSSARNIEGIDYDEDKIETASHNFLKTNSINFKTIDALELDEEKTYDCIIMLDILHYLTPQKQDVLLEKCIRLLNPNGKIILRDGVIELQEKLKGTKLTEFFSTKLLKFNKTENELHFISKNKIERKAKERNLNFYIIDETKFTSNIIMILERTI